MSRPEVIRDAMAQIKSRPDLRVLRGHGEALPAGARQPAVPSSPRPHRYIVLASSTRAPCTDHDPLHAASAGVGAPRAVVGTELSLIALIGIILPIGIVKKNAIMMIDFALEAERRDGREPKEAIRAARACCASARSHDDDGGDAGRDPVTSPSATARAAPAARHLDRGRPRPEPALTLYTTPVVYLYLDRFRQRMRRRLNLGSQPAVLPRLGVEPLR